MFEFRVHTSPVLPLRRVGSWEIVFCRVSAFMNTSSHPNPASALLGLHWEPGFLLCVEPGKALSVVTAAGHSPLFSQVTGSVAPGTPPPSLPADTGFLPHWRLRVGILHSHAPEGPQPSVLLLYLAALSAHPRFTSPPLVLAAGPLSHRGPGVNAASSDLRLAPCIHHPTGHGAGGESGEICSGHRVSL